VGLHFRRKARDGSTPTRRVVRPVSFRTNAQDIDGHKKDTEGFDGAPPSEPAAGKNSPSYELARRTKSLRKQIVRLFSESMNEDVARNELRRLAAVAKVTPPTPEDDVAEYARHILIGGHFTEPELHAIHEGLRPHVKVR
jgi:hypothetical protein